MARIGKSKCDKCGEPVWYKQTAGGALSCTCPECGWSGFARKNEPCHAKLMKELAPQDDKPAAPAAEPPKPATKPASSFLERL